MGFLGNWSDWRVAFMWMPSTYLAGAIPALIAGLIFCKVRQLIPWAGRRRNVLLHAGVGALVGLLTGASVYLMFFDLGSDLTLLERMISDWWPLGAPGLAGGALAGTFIGAGRSLFFAEDSTC
ncbi:hypothetical protein [Rhodoferax sp.]|uniref:hypothetical protein n=1 Tax=Rhodoferax sp. TaxID=50421 RepID=UPI0025E78599|nr:hypothetical protein [Rhodoferax sp.]